MILSISYLLPWDSYQLTPFFCEYVAFSQSSWKNKKENLSQWNSKPTLIHAINIHLHPSCNYTIFLNRKTWAVTPSTMKGFKKGKGCKRVSENKKQETVGRVSKRNIPQYLWRSLHHGLMHSCGERAHNCSIRNVTWSVTPTSPIYSV